MSNDVVQGNTGYTPYRDFTKVTDIVTLQDDMRSSPRDARHEVIIYGYITRLDLDLTIEEVVFRRCRRCKKSLSDTAANFHLLPKSGFGCPNPNCNFFAMDDSTCHFRLKLNITDHTGTLENCRVPNEVVERVLCPLPELAVMDVDQRTELKWKHFMMPLKMWVSVRGYNKYGTSVSILNWEKIPLVEMAMNTPVPPAQ